MSKKKQAEFAALALHQGLHSGSLYFYTLTYRNETTPIALHECDLDGPRVVGFERGCSDWLSSEGRFMNDLKDGRACSLCREDVKLVLKHFRTLCKDKDPKFSDRFKYAFLASMAKLTVAPIITALFLALLAKRLFFLRNYGLSVLALFIVLPSLVLVPFRWMTLKLCLCMFLSTFPKVFLLAGLILCRMLRSLAVSPL